MLLFGSAQLARCVRLNSLHEAMVLLRCYFRRIALLCTFLIGLLLAFLLLNLLVTLFFIALFGFRIRVARIILDHGFRHVDLGHE